jgi:hypothetical protein
LAVLNPVADLIHTHHVQYASPRVQEFARDLLFTETDLLLKSTRQYGRWKALRQNHPARAKDVAELVLDRHAMLDRARMGEPVDIDSRDRDGSDTGTLLGLRTPPQADAGSAVTASRAVRAYVAPVSAGIRAPNLGSAMIRAARNHYIGKRYKDRDCFTFLASALEDAGVRYYGSGGIRDVLVEKARNAGQEPNHLLTGEGLTGVLCRNPVQVQLPRIWPGSLESAWERLQPQLVPGALLSVSSRDFGHTGIVAAQGDQWTFINSARQYRRDGNRYTIKEENLKKELWNWLNRADRRKSFLTLTLGVPDQSMAQRFLSAPAYAQSG